jgi:hypothetical protein
MRPIGMVDTVGRLTVRQRPRGSVPEASWRPLLRIHADASC